jgi:hypothetical protein
MAAQVQSYLRRIDPAVATAFGCIILLLLLGSLVQSNFLSPEYLLQQLKVASFLGVIATGMFIIILLGQIDLSVPWVVAAGGMMAAAMSAYGPVGAALAIPFGILCGVIFGLNQAVSEALVLAETAGIERALAYDVLASSAVGAPYVAYKREAFLDPDGTPAAFALDLADKDLRLITGFADSLGVPHPQSTVNHALTRAAAADGHGDRDFSTVAVHLRQQVSAPAAAVADGGGSSPP